MDIVLSFYPLNFLSFVPFARSFFDGILLFSDEFFAQAAAAAVAISVHLLRLNLLVFFRSVRRSNSNQPGFFLALVRIFFPLLVFRSFRPHQTPIRQTSSKQKFIYYNATCMCTAQQQCYSGAYGGPMLL